MEGPGAAGAEGERGMCGEGSAAPGLWHPRAVGFGRCSPPAPGSPLGCGCPVCSAAASTAEQVGKAGRRAGGEQPRAGRMATKASPLRPDREKGVKNEMAVEYQPRSLFVLVKIPKIAVMLKCFRM